MPDEAETDLQRLTAFVWTVYDDLDALVSLREVLFLTPDRLDAAGVEFVRQLEPAWAEVKATRDSVISHLLSPSADEAPLFDQHGLTGSQLNAKLLIWRRERTLANGEFSDSDDVEPRSTSDPLSQPTGVETPEPSFSRKRPRRLKRALKWVHRMLTHADTVLGSLVRAFAFAQIEPLKEIKETIEKLAGDISIELPEET